MTPNHMHGRKRHSLTNKGKDQYHVGKVTRSKRRRLHQWSGRVQIMQVIHEESKHAERQAQLTPNICDFIMQMAAKRDLVSVVSRFQIFFRSLKCPIQRFICTENRSICHGVVRH